MKSTKVILFGSVLAFLAGGIASLLVVNYTESIESLLQFLAVTILLIVVVTRFIIPKLQQKTPSLVYFLQFAPLSMFVYLLVFSTGGLASPFLVLTHLFAIGMAFLISPNVSMAYVAITVSFIVFNIKTDLSAQELLKESPFAVFLYIMAYGAILPFSQYIAKIYKQKETWVNELSQMLVTSKKQEENLLKNIEDAVLVLTKELEISFINKAVTEKLGYGEKDLLNHKFSEVFRIKDDNGNNVEIEKKIPFSVVVNTKFEAKVDKLQISTKDNQFLRTNLKILPVIDHTGEVLGLMVIVKEYSQLESEVSENFDSTERGLLAKTQEALITFAADSLLMIRLESEISVGLSSFINLSEIVENVMFSLEANAGNKKISLKCPSPADNKVLPKGKVILPNKKCSFPVIFVLASQYLLEKAIERLSRIAIALCDEGKEVNFEVKLETDVVKVEIKAPTHDIPADKVNFLFTKFFNQSLPVKNKNDITGLEVVIASLIFEKHAGRLKAEVAGNEITFVGSLPRPELLKT